MNTKKIKKRETISKKYEYKIVIKIKFLSQYYWVKI